MVSSVLQEKSNQQQNSSLDDCKSSLITSNASANAPANQHSVDSRNSIHLMTAANTSNTTSTTNTTITGNSGINATNKAVNQTLPMHFTEHSSAQRHVQSHLHSKHSSFDGTSPNTQIKSNSELSVLEMGSNDSPTPSDMNSPVESCFANIMEDQGSDSFDLNNITPSINLSSSVSLIIFSLLLFILAIIYV
ncbi:unnamed protein product [Trichobilharzia regenti]|nr:unnamed protein product [Trichobilharzia regenti]